MALSGAEVRITIHPLPLFAGSVNVPVYVAPAWRTIVSPGSALLIALCRLPPAGTLIVAPACAGYDVSTDFAGSAGRVCAVPSTAMPLTNRRTATRGKSRRECHRLPNTTTVPPPQPVHR